MFPIGRPAQPQDKPKMSKAKRAGTALVAVLGLGVLIALLWCRSSVDAKLGYCKTPQETCVNRHGIPVGQPCECQGGVFGLDSTGTVVPTQ
jgi:hypothetical protein